MEPSPWDELEEAEAALLTATDLERRLAGEEAELTARAGRLLELTSVMVAEKAEVASLESFGLTRVWAALRGRGEETLERARAEALAAVDAEQQLATEVEASRRRIARLRAAIDALGDVRGRAAAARDAVEQHLVATGAPAAAELADLSIRSAAAAARATEIDEAVAAARQADSALATALDRLGRARDWATYDVLGGGMFTDAMKYDRMDDAYAWLRRAGAALRTLARELADIGDAGGQALRIEGWDQAFDVWFDNIFSDLEVRSRIVSTLQRTEETRSAVRSTHARLIEEQQALATERTQLRARREDLLRRG